MITCDSVDFPEPFGPINACTSPDATSRSTPRRISWPSTDACKPSMRSTVTIARSRHSHDHVVALDAHPVHRHRLGGRKALWVSSDERERRAVLRALDLELVVPQVALAERVVLV